MRLSFLGGTREVGRSAILVDTDTEKILMDYGLKINVKPTEYPKTVDVKLNAIFLSHTHLDHTGAVPLLFHQGQRCPVFCKEITRPLSRMLLFDSYKIAKYEGEEERFHKKDINIALRYFKSVKYKKPFKIGKTRATLLDAGHIPGSAMILLETKNKRILYTGDFNTSDTRLISGSDKDIPEVDVLITEATYAQREHPDREKEEMKMIETVRGTLANDGIALIACFAIARTQEMLLILDEYELDYPVYLDGMAQKATKIINSYPGSQREYNQVKRALQRQEVKFVTNPTIRKRIVKKPCIITTTSGMCLHPETLIQLPNGICTPISNVSSSIFSFNTKIGMLNNDLCLRRICKPSPEFLYEIKTSTGVIKATPYHKFFILNNLKILEKNASRLKRGDRIAFVKKIPFRGKTQPLNVKIGDWCSISKKGLKIIKNKRKRLKISQKKLSEKLNLSQSEISALELGKIRIKENVLDKILDILRIENKTFFKDLFVEFGTLKSNAISRVKIPKKVTPEFCQFLGYYLGDGDVHQNKEIRLTDKDVKNLKFYKKLAKKTFNIEGKIKQKERNRLHIHSTILAKLISSIVKGRSRTRKIPELIQKSSLQEVAAFLRGLFDAEGTVYVGTTNYIGISSASRNIIQVAQLLLLRFGIISKIQEVKSKSSYGKRAYYLTIHHPLSITEFRNKINFSSRNKKIKLNELTNKLKFGWSHLDILPIKKFEIYRHLKNFFKKIPKSHELNIWKNCKKSMTLSGLKKLINVLKIHKTKINSSKFEEFVKKLETLSNTNIIWSKILNIKKIKSDTKFVWDLTILQNPSYIANGFIVHNCTGGPIAYYLEKLWDREDCSLTLTGFQVPGTEGAILLETGIYVHGDLEFPLKMPYRKFDFSSHASRSELFKFVKKVNPGKVFCVHGDNTEGFAKELREEHGFDAVAPKLDNFFDLK